MAVAMKVWMLCAASMAGVHLWDTIGCIPPPFTKEVHRASPKRRCKSGPVTFQKAVTNAITITAGMRTGSEAQEAQDRRGGGAKGLGSSNKCQTKMMDLFYG